MEGLVAHNNDLNLKDTELRLGLPGSDESDNQKEESVSSCVKNTNNKRSLTELAAEDSSASKKSLDVVESKPAAKAQIVGWPPVRSYRKNSFQLKKTEAEQSGFFVKVSMDGAPYLRKIDLKVYNNYAELLKALENMFKLTIGEYSEREGYKGSEYAPAYEDKDGDLMLVGDVPWE
ncbi:OLC1v1019873C1 [Oldenlandia corymbosa var. corymbosa]|uniref:Auxin-responsive protein n=1 Tax=Oldenlandia corymbosa var. corymbosa TaxID=529605 RepID=A0AAV1EF99_OLDCO|nr:OLC1v1019873C1 [Oldenlandia corymbosa var. corymbosa]